MVPVGYSDENRVDSQGEMRGISKVSPGWMGWFQLVIRMETEWTAKER
jgi:hypothetical protein